MVYYCIIKDCFSTTKRQTSPPTWFVKVKPEWNLANLCKKAPLASSRICSKHFKERDFVQHGDGRQLLTKSAVPVIDPLDQDTRKSKHSRSTSRSISTKRRCSSSPVKKDLMSSDSAMTGLVEPSKRTHQPEAVSTIPKTYDELSKDMCRICLRNASRSSVHVSAVAEKYREVTDFVIQPTDVPQRVCLECLVLVQKLYEFVQTCKKTEDTLRALQEEVKSEAGYVLAENKPIATCFVSDVHIKEEFISIDCKPEMVPQSPVSYLDEEVDPAPEPELKLENTLPENRRKKRFDCKICGKSYAYEIVFEKHLETHKTSSEKTPAEDKIYTCSKCGKTFSKIENLRQHLYKVHDKSGSSVCDLCGKTVKTYILKRHRIQMHSEQPYKEERIPCETCGKLIAKHNISVHRKTHISVLPHERFLCNMCPSRSFKHKYLLRMHMRLHILGQIKNVTTDSRVTSDTFESNSSHPYHECAYCDKRFINDSLRKTHERVTHEKAQKQVQCEFEGCTKMFHLTSQMRGHLKKVHSETANVICPICGKSFKSKESYKNHQYSHSKSYGCPYKSCQRVFAHGYLLHDHMSKVHPEFKMPPRGTKLNNVDLSVFLPPGVK